MANRTSIIALLTGIALPLNCSTPVKEALIAVELSNGYTEPNTKSEAVHQFGRLDIVRLTGQKAGRIPGDQFVLVEGTRGKRAAKGMGSRPNLWVKRSDLLFPSELKPWPGCWPISSLDFVDGVIDFHISFTSNGAANGQSPEGGTFSAHVYSSKNIVVIKTRSNRETFYFLYDPSTRSVSSPLYDSITQKSNSCD